MERSAYTNTTGSSIRTFQTHPTTGDAPAQKTNQTPRVHVSLPSIKKRLPWIIVATLIVATVFMYSQYVAAKTKLHSPQAAASASKQVADTITRVSRIVIVPTDETPSVVTVADASKLKAQSFFMNAHDGDKVIVYTKAKEAILYRPSTNQIVTIAPVTSPN